MEGSNMANIHYINAGIERKNARKKLYVEGNQEDRNLRKRFDNKTTWYNGEIKLTSK